VDTFNFVFGAVMALGAFLLFLLGMRDLARAADSEDWPSVSGRVIESKVVISSGGRFGVTYDATVRYRYQVGEREYTGNRIAFLWIDASSPKAERAIARYPRDAVVEVRVSPTNPTLSVLEPGVHWYAYATVFVVAAFTGVGLAFALNALR